MKSIRQHCLGLAFFASLLPVSFPVYASQQPLQKTDPLAAYSVDFRLNLPKSEGEFEVVESSSSSGFFEVEAYILGEDGQISVCAARAAKGQWEIAKRCDRPHLFNDAGQRRAGSIFEIPLERYLRVRFPLAKSVSVEKIGALFRAGRGNAPATLLVFYKIEK